MNKKQKIMVGALLLMPLVTFILFSMSKLNSQGVATLNVGIVTLSGGQLDVLAWVLCVLVPASISIALGIQLKQLKLARRIIIPLLLCIMVIVLNMLIGSRVTTMRSFNGEDSSCSNTVINGNSTLACPVSL